MSNFLDGNILEHFEAGAAKGWMQTFDTEE